MIYVYWSGYFHELNIDTSFMKLSYDGFVFQVIFIATMLCAVIFLMYLVGNMFNNTREEIKKQPGTIWNRVICFFIQSYLPSPRICSFHFVQAQILSSPRGGRINVRLKMVLK